MNSPLLVAGMAVSGFFPARQMLSVVLTSLLVVVPVYAQETPAITDTQSASAMRSDASMTVKTGKVELTSFTRYLSLNGTVNAWQEVVIAAEVGGYRVEEVLVDIGDTVTQGQELVQLSSTILETERASRFATLKQREAELVNANLALDRAESMAEKSLLSAADLDRLRSEAIASEARLGSAQADLDAAEVRLRFSRVLAPDAGVISSRLVSVGQIAQAGNELLRLLRQNRVEWRGDVPESSMPALQSGQAATIISVDGREHKGTVRIVSPTVDANTHNGKVYVDINNDTALRPGMFARGKIEISQGDALVVPLNAIVTSDGYHYIFTVNADGTISRQMIETGIIQNDAIEVLSGLQAGASIVISGVGFLKDGDRVNVVGDL